MLPFIERVTRQQTRPATLVSLARTNFDSGTAVKNARLFISL